MFFCIIFFNALLAIIIIIIILFLLDVIDDDMIDFVVELMIEIYKRSIIFFYCFFVYCYNLYKKII